MSIRSQQDKGKARGDFTNFGDGRREMVDMQTGFNVAEQGKLAFFGSRRRLRFQVDVDRGKIHEALAGKKIQRSQG